jgi:hypothetical protein
MLRDDSTLAYKALSIVIQHWMLGERQYFQCGHSKLISSENDLEAVQKAMLQSMEDNGRQELLKTTLVDRSILSYSIGIRAILDEFRAMRQEEWTAIIGEPTVDVS